ncbi:Signal transduction histidine kinase [Lachnospiraceae bacterium XBB2008]|nr:Signal transduction histidine kinase [Lachnospiraceae bacterium XBB2008]
MNISPVFFIVAAISLVCVILGMRVRRRNYGYILSAALVVVCDILCYLLINCKSIQTARIYFILFFIVHSLLFVTALWMVAGITMGREHNSKPYMILAVISCVYQIAIIGANFFGIKTLGFSKHVFLGKNWWFAEGYKSYTVFFSFPIYQQLSFFSALIIIIMMIDKCVRSAGLFRPRFYALIAIQTILSAVESMSVFFKWPIWLPVLFMTVVCLIVFYYANYYATRTLREWYLLTFANEMSDGFILYDENNDLIHMNEPVTKNMPERLQKAFEDIDFLREWLSHTDMVEGVEVVDLLHDAPPDAPLMEEGFELFLSASSYDLGEEGTHVGTAFVLHNNSESIQKMRAMRAANEELERAARMKSDFLANMSHEIRTPMNAVIGMAELSLREELPPTVEEYLLQIKNSGRNLLNIINDILDYSKIESGKMELISEKYEPLSEINDIANIMQTRVGSKPIEFFVLADPDIPRVLMGDAMRIRQVIINLANNAVKFTQKGFVQIRMSVHRISALEVMMEYHVRDTGMGIREEDLDKLFVSFQQVDSKRNRSVEGTGLGLAISKSIVEAMGGTIGVSSTYGEGSDFFFSIPQIVVDPTPDLTVKDAEHKHAFCIDDDPLIYRLFLDEMERLGVDGHVLNRAEEYVPTGGKDYLFTMESDYGDPMRAVLDKYPELTGCVTVAFDSAFTPDRSNLRILRRPETTLNMVLILNDLDAKPHASESERFAVDFTAPEAKILIVDDNRINITIAEGLLDPIRVRCSSALSAREAIEMLEKEDFDIILMDHMMPEMDGIEATHYIREKIDSAKDTPIIALTANAMESAKDMFLKAGMNDFVAKPVEVRTLIRCIRKWLPAGKIIEGAPETTADEGKTLDTVIEYKGLDSRSAMKAIGSSSLYQKIVGEYYKSGQEKHDGIKDAYEAGDWEDYTIRVHALKSSSRQIGAAELGDMAEMLEHAGKAGDIETIRSSTGGLLDAFSEVLSDLAPFFAADPDEGKELPLIDENVLSGILDELAGACDDLDMDGMEEAQNKLRGYSYPDGVSELIEELFRAIESIDTEGCIELIDKIKQN